MNNPQFVDIGMFKFHLRLNILTAFNLCNLQGINEALLLVLASGVRAGARESISVRNQNILDPLFLAS